MGDALTRFLRQRRGLNDESRIAQALQLLQREGLLAPAYLQTATAAADGGVPPLFRALVALGRGDLSVARLFEGHANAVQLVVRLGSPQQRAHALDVAEAGGLVGVWGADDPRRPARLDSALGLSGRKIYASGADIVRLAVVAAKTEDAETQLLLLDGGRLADRFDASWWRASGMTATRSFALSLDDLAVDQDDLLGAPGVYERQPFFGGGAIRFVAAQLGGALAVWDAMRDHLAATGRHKDPHQAARLAHVLSDLEAAFSFVQAGYARVAPAIGWEYTAADPDCTLVADAARVAVEETVERIVPLAIRSIGCAGLMETHPLHAAVRDLMVYVRQPAPDAARVRLGVEAAGGSYRALFDDV